MLLFLGLMTTATTNNEHDMEADYHHDNGLMDANYNTTISSGEKEQLAGLDDATRIHLGLWYLFI